MRSGDTFAIEVDADGVVSTPGVDWGRKLEIIFRTHNHTRKGVRLVLRRKGHMTWGGRGCRQDYAETLYMLVELEKDIMPARLSHSGRPFTRTIARVLEEAEPKHEWRKAVAALIEKAKI